MTQDLDQLNPEQASEEAIPLTDPKIGSLDPSRINPNERDRADFARFASPPSQIQQNAPNARAGAVSHVSNLTPGPDVRTAASVRPPETSSDNRASGSKAGIRLLSAQQSQRQNTLRAKMRSHYKHCYCQRGRCPTRKWAAELTSLADIELTRKEIADHAAVNREIPLT